MLVFRLAVLLTKVVVNLGFEACTLWFSMNALFVRFNICMKVVLTV